MAARAASNIPSVGGSAFWTPVPPLLVGPAPPLLAEPEFIFWKNETMLRPSPGPPDFRDVFEFRDGMLTCKFQIEGGGDPVEGPNEGIRAWLLTKKQPHQA